MMAAAYPKKAPIKPNVQMRQLHWGKLADGKVKGTMWDGEVDDGHVTLDIDELEGMFAAVASKKEGDVEGRVRSETKGPKKPEVVTLVDPKTANNTAIALSRFRLPPGDPHPHPPPSPSPPTPHPGMHWLELFDSFAVNMTLFCCGALECVAVGWVYGTDRFAADTLEMTGRKLPKPLLYMYKFVIPAILGALAISTLYASIVSKYPFPPGGIAFGWMISITAMVPIFYCLLAGLVRGWRRRRAATSNLGIKARTVVARSLPREVQLSSVLSDVAGASSAGGVQLRGQVV